MHDRPPPQASNFLGGGTEQGRCGVDHENTRHGFRWEAVWDAYVIAQSIT